MQSSTRSGAYKKSAHRFLHTIQPTYAVGLVSTGLSHSTATFFFFLHRSAPLFLLSSFNLNSACFPQCDVHRSLSLSCSLPLRNCLSAALLLCGSLFFFNFHPPFLRLKDKGLHLIHPCVCPPVPENDTIPMFLVKPASYGGGRGSAAVLRPLQMAASCWSQ